MTQRSYPYAIPSPVLRTLIGLMIISTLLFVLGVTLERTTETGEAAGIHNETLPLATETAAAPLEVGEAHVEPTAAVAAHSEAGEVGEAHVEPTAAVAVHSEAGESRETHSEAVLGVNLESPALVIAAVVVWVALVLGLWQFGSRVVIPIILVAIATAVWDGREVITQLNRANPGIAVLAVVITLLHIAVAVLAWRAWSTARSSLASTG
ncbi:MAG: hypothetical protein ABI700_10405 [Chloroflexota bacterium]